MNELLQRRFQQETSFLLELQQALGGELEKNNLAPLTLDLVAPSFQELRTDPFDGSETWFGEWRSPDGTHLGSVSIHGSGQVYGQFDVLQPNPNNPKWFVEAVTAWGSREQLKSELQLIPALLD